MQFCGHGAMRRTTACSTQWTTRSWSKSWRGFLKHTAAWVGNNHPKQPKGAIHQQTNSPQHRMHQQQITDRRLQIQTIKRRHQQNNHQQQTTDKRRMLQINRATRVCQSCRPPLNSELSGKHRACTRLHQSQQLGINLLWATWCDRNVNPSPSMESHFASPMDNGTTLTARTRTQGQSHHH